MLRIGALSLLFILGISALSGSLGLLADPTGDALQMPLSLLDGTPFKNFLIPAIILFTVIGLSSIVIIILTMRKVRKYSVWIVLQGIVLLIWLTAELLFNKDIWYSPLHIPYYLLAAILILIGWRLRKPEEL